MSSPPLRKKLAGECYFWFIFKDLSLAFSLVSLYLIPNPSQLIARNSPVTLTEFLQVPITNVFL